MIDIITVNPLDNFRSVHETNSNFIVCHNYVSDLKVTTKVQQVNHFNVFYENGNFTDTLEELEESYGVQEKGSVNPPAKFYSASYISEALDKIAKQISRRVNKTTDEFDEEEIDPIDIQVICVMDENIAKTFVSYLNKRFREQDIQVECEAVSLLRYMKIPNMDQFVQSMKRAFNTDFIYPEDPVQFSYVCRQFIEGRFR